MPRKSHFDARGIEKDSNPHHFLNPIKKAKFIRIDRILQKFSRKMNPLERLEIHLENSNEGTYQTGQNVPGKLVVILRRSLKVQGNVLNEGTYQTGQNVPGKLVVILRRSLKVQGNVLNEGTYQTGQNVTGKLVVILRRSLRVQGIEIKVRGRGHAQWNEGEADTEQLLFETEDYTRQSIVLVGKVPDKNTPPHIVFLDSGENTFHFNFTVPENIPSSFEGLHGYIRYWVKAKIYGVWGLLDQSGKVEFVVQRPLDLNTVPGAIDAAEDEDSCIMCGCCINEYVHASLRINKRGFIPGESIVVNAEIDNGSDTSLKSSKIKFYRVFTYGDSPFESNTIEKKTLAEKSRGKIKAGREEIYSDEELKVPPLLPVTSLPGCSFIDVDYVVEEKIYIEEELKVPTLLPVTSLPGCSFMEIMLDYVAELKISSPMEEYNLRIPLLVIIGTVPFGGSAHEHKPIDSDQGDLFQPFQPEPVIVDAGKRITTPTISVAPIGTELQALYPPMRNLSILERERTLGEIYKRRKRAVRFIGAVNEGAEFDEDIYREPTSGLSRGASYVSVKTNADSSQLDKENKSTSFKTNEDSEQTLNVKEGDIGACKDTAL